MFIVYSKIRCNSCVKTPPYLYRSSEDKILDKITNIDVLYFSNSVHYVGQY